MRRVARSTRRVAEAALIPSRVIMQVLRHAEVSVTMKIYSQASSDATRDALKRLSESLR
ncbi:hypothetical protein Misp04_17730 [Micromonospora sp. NBRC 101691]|nr:hypothetical protein Misp04_17730 [Micromonospora sp. NBRC 101691]